jgi:hypothetical protein
MLVVGLSAATGRVASPGGIYEAEDAADEEGEAESAVRAKASDCDIAAEENEKDGDGIDEKARTLNPEIEFRQGLVVIGRSTPVDDAEPV